MRVISSFPGARRLVGAALFADCWLLAPEHFWQCNTRLNAWPLHFFICQLFEPPLLCFAHRCLCGDSDVSLCFSFIFFITGGAGVVLVRYIHSFIVCSTLQPTGACFFAIIRCF